MSAPEFDPEKVERWTERTRCLKPFVAPKNPFTEVVKASDYDRLLEMYRASLEYRYALGDKALKEGANATLKLKA